jgi:hypothetical protein
VEEVAKTVEVVAEVTGKSRIAPYTAAVLLQLLLKASVRTRERTAQKIAAAVAAAVV